MNLNTLQPAAGSNKDSKRIGRGPGSGKGGTSTRGHKGAKSRSGYHKKIGFEGGQMPLQRRLPKFGFKNINRIEYKAVNLFTLQALADKGIQKITPEVLLEAGIINASQLVKVLAKGTLNAAVEVEANGFSAAAIKAIETAGGKATVIGQPADLEENA